MPGKHPERLIRQSVLKRNRRNAALVVIESEESGCQSPEVSGPLMLRSVGFDLFFLFLLEFNERELLALVATQARRMP